MFPLGNEGGLKPFATIISYGNNEHRDDQFHHTKKYHDPDLHEVSLDNYRVVVIDDEDLLFEFK